MGGKGGVRILNLMISHDLIEWGSRFEGPDGPLLLLVLMFLWVYPAFSVFISQLQYPQYFAFIIYFLYWVEPTCVSNVVRS